MSPVTIHLTPSEVELAAFVGMRRQATSLAKGSKPRFPERKVGELWAHHIMGAHAELAVAKALPSFWGGANKSYHVPDIPNTNFEVRWSMRHDLKVRQDDDGIVIAVRGACPVFEIVGWIKASAAKQPQWKAYADTNYPAYFVPYAKLHPFQKLQHHIRKRQALTSGAA